MFDFLSGLFLSYPLSQRCPSHGTNLTEAATSGTTLPDSVSEAIYHRYLPDSIGLEVSYYESYVVLCSFIGWAVVVSKR